MYHIVSYCITKSDRVCRPRKRESDCHLPTDRFALSCERVLSNSAFSLQPRAHPLGLRRLSHKCLIFFLPSPVRSRAQSPKSEEATVPEPLANSGVPLLACKSGTTSLDLAVLVRQNEKRLEKEYFFLKVPWTFRSKRVQKSVC